MKQRVLVVEDEPDIRELIVFTLTNQGYEVVGAECGEEAWIEAAKKTPALLVLDVLLPDTDGLSLCEMFRKIPQTATMPILRLGSNPGAATSSATPNPTAPSLSFSLNGTSLEITFGTQTGFTYQPISTTNLDGTITWSNEGSAIPGTGNPATILVPATGAQKFVQVRAQ